MDEAPAYVPPILGFTLAYDQNISEQAKAAERSPKPNGLLRSILNEWLDHQEVQVATRGRITTRV